ncbi:acetolactate synthase-1/3 small subunit [Rhizobacter sp. SG703]|nr:acetolactate synthase-1/3 small subunit [Rhizobacter sp. SG703]
MLNTGQGGASPRAVDRRWNARSPLRPFEVQLSIIDTAWPRPVGYRRRSEERAPTTMKHIIALLLENEPGALSRVVALFSARGYNIESLTVAPTEDASLSRMTIVTTGSDEVIEQITKHLNRLIEVVKVVDLTEGAFTERELMLIKVRAVGKEREEMKRMADIFRGRIIDVTEKSYTIELTGDASKLDAFIEAIDRGAILETVRTGTSGIGRGERILRV